ncbi:c6 transcription factor [Trichoderma arundinaceum]|uniref:C6 transcription factor n=1 Tax=Trichoderma arundinaceum TaxID=490622 RepID=A0A395NGL6_TRIAR|nr:c6 transcription factor [Trichoderma arundinaceum]
MVTTRASSRAASVEPSSLFPATPSAKRTKSSTSSSKSTKAFAHAPTTATLAWLAISLPLVVWDTGYVLLRPLSMPGGSLHWPVWAPYKLYGEVDHIYGFKAFHAGNGFTSAQGLLNAVETLLYLWYLWVWYFRGKVSAEGVRVVGGRAGARAALVGFSAAVMTFSKTFLYWANEYYSGFDNIGHNPLMDLIFLWIIPNGAWLVGSAYMIWSIGGSLVSGLDPASRSKSD